MVNICIHKQIHEMQVFVRKILDQYHPCLSKFVFSKKATKLMKSAPSIWHLHNVNLMVKILSIFVAFLENMNFITNCSQIWNLLSVVVCICQNKVQLFWEGHKNLEQSSSRFWHYLVTSKLWGGLYQIFCLLRKP